MCGIAGLVARRNASALEPLIREMTERVRHRGPDGRGHCVRGRVALGHRRLAILDLSPAGHQPMEYADGRYAITFNGEIYNYIELRAELKRLGYEFRSDGDTEVVLAAYAAWGPDCLSRFNGMWAFALHDLEEDTVFAARDRFGVKPFHYVQTADWFAFGSEIRQLLPLLPSVAANPRLVSEFLLTGVQTQSEDTFFENVSNLLPGHFLVFDVATGQYRIQRYYDLLERLDLVHCGEPAANARDEVHAFRGALDDAVRLRLRSDVRVGTCLSGGLDSSSIAMIAARMHRQHSDVPFSAVTAISEDPRNSEERYAGQIVEAGGLDWIRTQPSYDDFCGLLPHVVRHQEEPFSSPSICMQAFVMRAARENGIVVLLDGQGGDETLLGYESYYPAYCVMLWRTGGVRQVWRGMRQTIRSNTAMTVPRLVALSAFELVPRLRHLYYRSRNSYVSPAPPLPAWVREFASRCLDVRRLQALEVETTTLPSLLRFEDKNSMAFSIEARLPFLDYRLLERSIALPADRKLRDGWTKWILRQAMSDLLPHDIAWRRNKIGFGAPDDLWLSRHMERMVEAVRRSDLIRRFCNMDRLLPRFGALTRKNQWQLYSLALWEREFGIVA